MGCGDLTSAVAMLPQPRRQRAAAQTRDTEPVVPTFSGSTVLIGYMTTMVVVVQLTRQTYPYPIRPECRRSWSTARNRSGCCLI
jgi:hypothetical protein